MPKNPEIAPIPGWDGFYQPNYTPVPDDFFDILLPQLTDVEVRVLLYIIRRTLGFKKAADAISLGQLTGGIVKTDGTRLDNGAGVSKNGACLAIERLTARGIIAVEHRRAADGGYAPTSYRLRMQGTSAPLSPPGTRVVPTGDKDSPRRAQGLAPMGDIQESSLQETVSQETDDSNRSTPTKKRKTHAVASTRLTNPEVKQATRPTTATPNPQPPTPNPRPPMSLYIAQVIEDHSRELGDRPHTVANVTQALRLWEMSGLDEPTFVAVLHEVRSLVRHYQSSGIDNKMAYYFGTLRERITTLPHEPT